MPFRLGTTSYIIPDEILPNVRFLAPYVDEIELVLFESGRSANLPSRVQVGELICLKSSLEVTYNVHLPVDLYLGDPDSRIRARGREAALRFYERTFPLGPEAYILHLDWRRPGGGEAQNGDRDAWLRRIGDSLEWLLVRGMDPTRVAVENLGYPLRWIEPLVRSVGMHFCLDVGHLIRYGFGLEETLSAYMDRAAMIHLHGVSKGEDHRSLEALDHRTWEILKDFLCGYEGGVSLEVFSLADLEGSLKRVAGLAL